MCFDQTGDISMDEQRQDDKLELTYSNFVPIRDVTLKTCRKQWTMGRCGERRSEISVLIARHDDVDVLQLQCFQLLKLVLEAKIAPILK